MNRTGRTPTPALSGYRMAAALAVLVVLMASAGTAVAEERPPAPDFDLTAVDGSRHSLADYAGRVLVVNFWATWCAPCREEMPALARLRQRMHNDGVEVLAIDFGEPREDVQRFADEVALDLPLLLDPNGTQAPTWKVRALPTTYIVDRRGRIALTIAGEREWDSDQVVEALRAIANEP